MDRAGQSGKRCGRTLNWWRKAPHHTGADPPDREDPDQRTERLVQIADRPEKRNCMSPKLNRQMKRVLEELEFHDDIGVVVLTGEGTAWSAGMDLKEYFRENEEKGLGQIRQAQREAYGW